MHYSIDINALTGKRKKIYILFYWYWSPRARRGWCV